MIKSLFQTLRIRLNGEKVIENAILNFSDFDINACTSKGCSEMKLFFEYFKNK